MQAQKWGWMRIFFYLGPFSLVRPRRRLSLVPTAARCSRRGEAVKVDRRSDRATSSADSRSHLDRFEHDGTIVSIGPD